MTKYDWDYWRHRYVSGADCVTLELLCRHQGAPALNTLKKRSTKESWAEQRRQFRHQAATIATQSATAQEVFTQTAQLVDAAELITRHIKLAKALQGKAIQALQKLDPDDLTARDILSWLTSGTQIERLTLGLATERIAVDAAVDFAKLSDVQLQQLIDGKDIEAVLRQQIKGSEG